MLFKYQFFIFFLYFYLNLKTIILFGVKLKCKIKKNMKQILFALVLLASFGAKSQTKDPVDVFTVTSTCGTISKLMIPKKAGMDEVKKKIQDENRAKCGVTPKHVNITVNTKK